MQDRALQFALAGGQPPGQGGNVAGCGLSAEVPGAVVLNVTGTAAVNIVAPMVDVNAGALQVT